MSYQKVPHDPYAPPGYSSPYPPPGYPPSAPPPPPHEGYPPPPPPGYPGYPPPGPPPHEGYPPPPPPGYPGYPPSGPPRGYQGYFAEGYPPPLAQPQYQQCCHYEHHHYQDNYDGCSSFLRGCTSATFEVRTPSRIQVEFKEGTLQPPKKNSNIDLPENIDLFGQKINLSPVQQSLNPLQEAAANIGRTLSGQPPFKVPIPGNLLASYYLP